MKKFIALLLALMLATIVLASCEVVPFLQDNGGEETTTTDPVEETTTKKPFVPHKPGTKPEETTPVAPPTGGEELEFPQLPV